MSKERPSESSSASASESKLLPGLNFRKLADAIRGQKLKELSPSKKVQQPEEVSPPQQTVQMKEKIKKLWGPTLSPSTLPGATIKINSLAPRPSLPTHLPDRQFALPRQQKAAEADYTVLQKIADGGMGSVFIGEQSALKRQVAIKTIKEDVAQDQQTSTQFLTEALVTGDLDHPNIVPIYELGTNGDGLYFYTMKHVRGVSWDECIEKKSQDENLDILMKVCDAVAFAHSRGIIHRDLKPDNIMIGEFGEVMLMDWGLASAAVPGEKSELFGTGTGLGGTPAYMAPEAAQGKQDKIGTATDIYLLGALLFEIISGSPPHDAKKAEDSLAAAVENKIPKLSFHSELLTIAMKAMQTEPEDRYPSVLELQQHIRDYRQHEESLTLTSNAEDNYTRARVNESYGEYSAGMNACFEALKLWKDNVYAKELRNNIRLDYARLALKRQDYDLCLTLLREENAEDRGLIRKATRLREERTRRLQMQQRLKYTLVATVAFTLLLMVVAYTALSRQNSEAVYRNFITQTRLAEQLLRQGNWVEVEKISRTIPRELRGWEWNWMDHACRLKLTAAASLPETPDQVIVSRNGSYHARLFSSSGVLLIKTPEHSYELNTDDPIHAFHWSEEERLPTAVLLEGTTVKRYQFLENGKWRKSTLQKQLPDQVTAISPSGQYYVRSDSDHQVFVHETKSNRQLSQLALEEDDLFELPAFSTDEELVAGFISSKHRLKVFNTVTGAIEERSAPHGEYQVGPTSRMTFSHDNKLLLVMGKGQVIYINNLKHLNPKATLPLQFSATAMTLSADGENILAATRQGELLVFHIPTAEIIWNVKVEGIQIEHVSHTDQAGEWLLYDSEGDLHHFSQSTRKNYQLLVQNEVPILYVKSLLFDNAILSRDQRIQYQLTQLPDTRATPLKIKSERRSMTYIIPHNGVDHLFTLDGPEGARRVNLETGEQQVYAQFQGY
ncbi:MAG: protein kinase, partial [Gammaproteobacteria bacterium]|nr:protein kinase [Gammaproteobacteria bacterium]